MTWLKTIQVGNIDSWKDLRDAFIAQKRQPMTMIVLSRVTQQMKETRAGNSEYGQALERDNDLRKE